MSSLLLLKDKAFVNGTWVSASSGSSFAINNPYDGKEIISVPDMGIEDTNNAIDAAATAFKIWKKTTAKERAAILRKWFELCNENSEELAQILTSEQGKPIKEARVEVKYGSSFLEWFGEEARRIQGDVVPAPVKNRQIILTREPIGVAAMITPWNFPIAMITRKVGAALATGCTCVIKPAEDTPLSALALAALAEKAGLPKGVLNIITCKRESSADVGKALCMSPKVDILSFTGSTRVGKILYGQCASTVKRISLELGGNAPFIVFESADLDEAVTGCIDSKFRNMGQTCMSNNRMFVHSSIYDVFLAKLEARMKKDLVLGEGTREDVTQGPLVNQRQLERLERLVNDAIAQGAKCLVGGSKHEAGDLFYKPTILEGVNSSMELYMNEIFGPVVSIIKFESEKEVIALANDVRVGLASYIYSNDQSQCWRVPQDLETGMVGINIGMFSCAEGAHGGVKESGIGREGSRYGIDEYTEWKYMCFGNL